MTKKVARAFRAPEDDEIRTPEPHKTEAPAASQPAPPAEVPGAAQHGRPEYRQGRKNLSVWVDEKAHRTLKAIAAEEGVSLQDYMIDILNREFARKGRPQIAK
jgi:hypothetical protein